jgi:hypothetical protein
MPEAVVRWCAHCWARWGGIGGGNFYILGVAGFITSIWDVLAPQGERLGAEKRLRTCSRSPDSKLGKRCQLGSLGVGFTAGLVGLGSSYSKICTPLATLYLHIIYYFLYIGGRGNGWMRVDEFGCQSASLLSYFRYQVSMGLFIAFVALGFTHKLLNKSNFYEVVPPRVCV